MDCTRIIMNLIDNVAEYTHKNKNEITKEDCNMWLSKLYYPAIKNFYGDEIINIQRGENNVY